MSRTMILKAATGQMWRRHAPKTLWLVLLLAAVMMALSLSARAQNLRPDNARSLCLDLAGDAELARCDSTQDQLIKMPPPLAPGSLALFGVLQVRGRCVGVAREGQSLLLSPCVSLKSQQWLYTTDGVFRNGLNLCMDVNRAGTSAGTPVIGYRCHKSINQRWTQMPVPDISLPSPVYRYKHVLLLPRHVTGKCLDRDASSNKLQLWRCHGGPNQSFYFNDSYTSIAVDRLCLVATAGGGPVKAADCSNNRIQIWTVSPGGEIRSSDNYCLDVRGAGVNDGTELITYRCNGNSNQRFATRRH